MGGGQPDVDLDSWTNSLFSRGLSHFMQFLKGKNLLEQRSLLGVIYHLISSSLSVVDEVVLEAETSLALHRQTFLKLVCYFECQLDCSPSRYKDCLGCFALKKR